MSKKLLHAVPLALLTLLALQVYVAWDSPANASGGDVAVYPAQVEIVRGTPVFVDARNSPEPANGVISVDFSRLTVAELERVAAADPVHMAGNKSSDTATCICPVMVGNCSCVINPPPAPAPDPGTVAANQ